MSDLQKSFHQWSKARSAVHEGLALQGIAAEQATALASFIDSVVDALEASSRPTRRQGLIVRTWVVRDDDIDLTRTVCDGIVAAAGSSFFSGGRLVPSVTGTAVAIFRALRGVYARGVRLSDQEIGVLLLLKRHGPLTESDLHKIHPNSGVSRRELGRMLRGLRAVAVQDGGVVALVEQDSRERWTTSC